MSHTSIDFNWSLEFFTRQGKALYGEGFTIFPVDHDVIYKMLVYFLGMEAEAERLGLNLRKGLLISGRIGCGKSKWLSLMQLVAGPERRYVVKSCRDVSFEFIQEGYDVIHRYSRHSFRDYKPRAYGFDDLGTEQNLKYYGNECNVMGEILLSRYDFYANGMVTHVTTNLSATEVETYYGNRLRSRMREMFNLIAFSKDSPDKRV